MSYRIDDTVYVVVALIFKTDPITQKTTILMQLRRPNGPRPNLWEMPGGKLEPIDSKQNPSNGLGEALQLLMTSNYNPERTQVCGLQRELQEELGIAVAVGPEVARHIFKWKTRVFLTLYHCLIIEGEPIAKEAVKLEYVDLEDALENRPMAPFQYETYAAVLEYIESYNKRLAVAKAVAAFSRGQAF